MEITNDDNGILVNTDNDQYEEEADQKNNYVDILEFGIENAPDPSSTK